MKKSNLKPRTFDDHLLQHFFDTVRQPGNHIRISNTKFRLKPDVIFLYTDAPNRNYIVSKEIWSDLIRQHLKRYNYQ